MWSVCLTKYQLCEVRDCCLFWFGFFFLMTELPTPGTVPGREQALGDISEIDEWMNEWMTKYRNGQCCKGQEEAWWRMAVKTSFSYRLVAAQGRGEWEGWGAWGHRMQTITLGMDIQWDPAEWYWELCLDTCIAAEQRVEKIHIHVSVTWSPCCTAENT